MTNGELGVALRWAQRAAAAGDGVGDGELLDRFVSRGDEAAFELLVWRHQRLVFGVCRRVLGDTHDAEDAFQAAFLVLARKGHSIGRGDRLPGWLYKVAHRCALDMRAARTRLTRREQPLTPADEPAQPVEPCDPAERDELRAVLDEEVGRLPDAFRAPTVLCYLAGKSLDEAAAQLGCPRGTVASRLARARERLRTRLARRGLALPAGLAAWSLAETAHAASASDGLIRATVGLLKLSATERAAAAGAATLVAAHVVRIMFLRKLLIGAAALAACALLFVMGGVAFQALAHDRPGQAPPGEPPAQPPAAAQAPVQVPAKAAPAKQAPAAAPQPDPNVAEFTGRLEASKEVDIRSRAAGVVTAVRIKPGDKVTRAAVIIEMDPRPAQLALEQAKANLTAAEAQAKLAVTTLERIRRLAEQKAVDRAEVDTSEANAAAALASVQVARAKVEQAKLMLDYTQIAAPIDGVVSKVQTTPGSVIAASDNTPALATLISTHPIALRFEMDERTFLRYRQLGKSDKIKDLDIRVALASDEKGYPHRAMLMRFGSTLNPKRGTIEVEALLPNQDGLLLPGMFARVRVTAVTPPSQP
jgi:RND family efflux transporter MFP subunit